MINHLKIAENADRDSFEWIHIKYVYRLVNLQWRVFVCYDFQYLCEFFDKLIQIREKEIISIICLLVRLMFSNKAVNAHGSITKLEDQQKIENLVPG